MFFFSLRVTTSLVLYEHSRWGPYNLQSVYGHDVLPQEVFLYKKRVDNHIELFCVFSSFLPANLRSLLN